MKQDERMLSQWLTIPNQRKDPWCLDIARCIGDSWEEVRFTYTRCAPTNMKYKDQPNPRRNKSKRHGSGNTAMCQGDINGDGDGKIAIMHDGSLEYCDLGISWQRLKIRIELLEDITKESI